MKSICKRFFSSLGAGCVSAYLCDLSCGAFPESAGVADGNGSPGLESAALPLYGTDAAPGCQPVLAQILKHAHGWNDVRYADATRTSARYNLPNYYPPTPLLPAANQSPAILPHPSPNPAHI